MSIGHLGGFPVSAEVYRALVGTTTSPSPLTARPAATIELPASDLRSADPVGLVTRLENRLAQLEARKATALADIDHARRQITHARDSIGQPFPHAGELAAARERARQIDEALDRMAQQDASRAQAAGHEAGDTGSRHEPGSGQTDAEMGAAPGVHARNDRYPSAQREQADSLRRQPPARRTGPETWTRPGN